MTIEKSYLLLNTLKLVVGQGSYTYAAKLSVTNSIRLVLFLP